MIACHEREKEEGEWSNPIEIPRVVGELGGMRVTGVRGVSRGVTTGVTGRSDRETRGPFTPTHDNAGLMTDEQKVRPSLSTTVPRFIMYWVSDASNCVDLTGPLLCPNGEMDSLKCYCYDSRC